MSDHRDLLAALGVELAPELLEWALTDSSYVTEDEVLANERLEFLGDAVAGFVVTDQLMLEHPLASEDQLAKYRRSVFNMLTLADLARSLGPGGLGAHLRYGSAEHRDRALVLADTLEAVFGAIYLQHGISVVTEVVRRLFEPLIRGTVGSARANDPIRKPPWPNVNTEVTIYSSSDAGEHLRDALLDVLNICGFDFVAATYPVVGSWFQRLFVRERDSTAGKRLEHLAGRLERAAELKYINTPRSETDEREANAIARLAEAMATMDEVIIRTSSVLFIKTGGRVLSWVLTEDEITVLNDNPQLMKSPLAILDALPRIKGAALTSTDNRSGSVVHLHTPSVDEKPRHQSDRKG